MVLRHDLPLCGSSNKSGWRILECVGLQSVNFCWAGVRGVAGSTVRHEIAICTMFGVLVGGVYQPALCGPGVIES